jgi:hypothetical protein
MPPSLLDEIELAYHEHLLANGNLHPPRKKEWTGENQWEFLGYRTELSRIKCICGATHDTLLGIFSVQKSPSGALKLDRLDETRSLQIPADPRNQVQITVSNARICPSCLFSKGFSRN